MSEKKARSAQSYRIRAEMLRTLAEMDEYSATGQMLRQVANDYDRMAQAIEAAERPTGTSGRRRTH